MPPTNIPTEPIGSIPRPQNLIDAMSQWNRSEITREAFDAVAQAAVSDTIRRFEASSADLSSSRRITLSRCLSSRIFCEHRAWTGTDISNFWHRRNRFQSLGPPF
jgi:hypothetical protein